MGKEEGFVQKEPDSLATQAALVSDASYSYVQSISPSTSDGSEVRQKHILFPLAHSDKASLETAFYEMMAVYEGDSYVEESYHTNFDAAYEAYVTRLRFLRREQAQQLADLGIKSQRDASSYIESRSHIPKDTEFLLTMLGRSSVHYKPSLDESRQVLEHPQMLSGAVRSLYENDKAAFSSFVLRSESKLNRYVDSDTMVELLSGLYVDDSSTLISNFSSFKTYFGRENLQPFVDNAVQKVVADIRQLMSAGESTPEQYKQTQEKMYYLLKFLQDEAKVATLAIGTETPLLDASQITAYTLEVLDSIKKVDFWDAPPHWKDC